MPILVARLSHWISCILLLFQEALRHILIVFAKLNPGIRYVQGMNEVLAPLFYVFRNDPDENSAVWSYSTIFVILVFVPCDTYNGPDGLFNLN